LKSDIKIFSTPEELARSFASWLMDFIAETGKRQSSVTIALPGGNTPRLFFSILAEKYSATQEWGNVHIFWGDERCVPPDDPESNYGEAYELFLKKINLPAAGIHRIMGEEDPDNEALRYSDEIKNNTRSRNALPALDLIILGLGNDGHTASIFPGKMALLDSEKICGVAVHPDTGQKRITLTGRVINNADNIVFLVTGENKARVIQDVLIPTRASVLYPASHIAPQYGKLFWFLDKGAARLIL